MTAPTRRLPARFPTAAWEQDLAAASPTGVEIARQARRRYERDGVPLTELRPCDPEARDGTRLKDCVKTYLPPPAGRFGMVFQVARAPERVELAYLAFGARHHPRGSRTPTVYELAHHRLHNMPPPRS
jgi:hypothetical protein